MLATSNILAINFIQVIMVTGSMLGICCMYRFQILSQTGICGWLISINFQVAPFIGYWMKRTKRVDILLLDTNKLEEISKI